MGEALYLIAKVNLDLEEGEKLADTFTQATNPNPSESTSSTSSSSSSSTTSDESTSSSSASNEEDDDEGEGEAKTKGKKDEDEEDDVEKIEPEEILGARALRRRQREKAEVRPLCYTALLNTLDYLNFNF